MNSTDQGSPNHKPVDVNETLYRGVTSDQLIDDHKLKRQRPSSVAFSDKFGKLSVDQASKTTPEESLKRLSKSKAVANFPAQIPINFDYDVVEDPIIEENPAHALILSGGKPMKKVHCKQIAKECSLFFGYFTQRVRITLTLEPVAQFNAINVSPYFTLVDTSKIKDLWKIRPFVQQAH
jgi:hypothetical protein